jgi:hypothetical protein
VLWIAIYQVGDTIILTRAVLLSYILRSLDVAVLDGLYPGSPNRRHARYQLSYDGELAGMCQCSGYLMATLVTRADERGGKRVQITWARKGPGGPDSVKQGLFFFIFEWKEKKIVQFFNFQLNSN